MEYVERLKDESVLYTVLCQSQQWFEASSASHNVARIVLRRLEHVYAKVSRETYLFLPSFLSFGASTTCTPS